MCTCALAAEAGTRAAKVGIVCAHVRGDGHGESKQADGMPRGVKAEMSAASARTRKRRKDKGKGTREIEQKRD